MKVIGINNEEKNDKHVEYFLILPYNYSTSSDESTKINSRIKQLLLDNTDLIMLEFHEFLSFVSQLVNNIHCLYGRGLHRYKISPSNDAVMENRS